MSRRITAIALCLLVSLAVTPLLAKQPWVNDDDLRYMALGDSLAAGFAANPATQGYVYRLYAQNVFAPTPSVLFSNSAVPGATSTDILLYQVPQVPRFVPDVVTLSAGGNDLLAILGGADPGAVLTTFQLNLTDIVTTLCSADPPPTVIVANQYTIPEIIDSIPDADFILDQFNVIVDGVVAGVQATGCDVRVADVYSAFLGRSGLLLIEKKGASPFEVHLTNAGHGVMADAFREAWE
jgi:lysophospholipase L1-like esterase